MAIIVFSHGFGVKADARGMFTEIATAFPKHTSVTFDYNTIHVNGDIEVSPLTLQAQKLESIISTQKGKVVIIAHSQGCLTTGMIDLSNVKKVILLAPPVKTGMQRVVAKLMKKPDAEINLNGISKFPRSDGTTTLISKEYIDSISNIDAMELYRSIASSVPTVIVRCTEDEVLGITDVNEINGAECVDVPADHNFTGNGRTLLLHLLSEQLKA